MCHCLLESGPTSPRPFRLDFVSLLCDFFVYQIFRYLYTISPFVLTLPPTTVPTVPTDTEKKIMSKRGRSSGRDENDGGSKRQRRTTTTLPSSTLKRLDPLILARGSTPRWVGARTKLAILTPEEIDRDLRHMEAYANACTAYAQQYFIYSNRNLVQSGHYGATTTSRKEHNLVMPVRIDPEEEKRISQLRARIAASEKLREVLETEYVSLRAAYVYESHFLSKTRNNVDSQLTFLQSLIRQRGHVVALQRVRCAMARDVLSCLTARTFGIENDNNDMLQVWNTAEMQLKEARRNLKQQESGDVMLWNARTLPRTPNDLPLYLSQLSCAPDKGAGFGTLLLWCILLYMRVCSITLLSHTLFCIIFCRLWRYFWFKKE